MQIQSFPRQNINFSSNSKEKKTYGWHAVASFMLPGTGQFIKGDKRKGKIDLGVHIGTCVGMVTCLAISVKDFNKQILKNSRNFQQTVKSRNMLSLAGIFSLGGLINRIQSTYDAYKSPPHDEAENN